MMSSSDPARVPRPRQHPEGLLSISVSPPGAPAVVVLVGEVDVATAPHLRSTVGELLAAGRNHIIIDLDGVTFLDAAALNTLITATSSAADAGGALHLTHHPRCMQLLAFTGETHLVNVTRSLRTSTNRP